MLPGLAVVSAMPATATVAKETSFASAEPADPPRTPKQHTGTAAGLPPLMSTSATQSDAGKRTAKTGGGLVPKGAVPVESREGLERLAGDVGYCSSWSQYSGGSSYSAGSEAWFANWQGIKHIYRALVYVPRNQNSLTTYYEGGVEKPYWTQVGSCKDAPPDPDYPPSLTAAFPLVGMLVGTRTPLLGVQASSAKGAALSYAFTACTDQGLKTGCVSSGTQDGNTWRVPAGGKLAWSTQYWWRVTVTDQGNGLSSTWSEGTFTTGVRQPATGSLFSTQSPDGQDFQPATGNYTTSATDAVVASAGPPLLVTRTYNSLDPRRDGMFGAGWSTRWDAKLTVEHAGAAQITFPDGRQVRFAPDGGTAATYQPPPGMYATLKRLDVPSCIPEDPDCDTSRTPAWQLMDKASTSYYFNEAGQLIKIADLRGRTQEMEHGADGKLAKVTAAGGRHLAFTWTGDHVTQVATNPVNGTPLKWSYTYSGDTLTSACAPGQPAACTTYTPTPGSQYYSAVRNSDPLGYWRLGESAGTEAADSGAGAGEATYESVTLGQSGAVEASTDKSAQFTGTSSLKLQDYAVSQLQDAASVEAWFKTTQTGVIMAVDTGGGTRGTAARSAIYVGSDGKLRGQFRPTTGTAAIAPITSTGVVNDGQWHHVVLTLAGTRQEMFLDGQSVGTATGSGLGGWPIAVRFGKGTLEGGAWPGGPAATQPLGLVGLLDEVALYDKPLTAQDVALHYVARAAAPHLMAKITLPSGRVKMQADYDSANDRIKTYTDGNGGAWQLSAPVDDRRKGASIVTVTDPAAGTVVYGYDGWRGLRLTARADQLGKKTTYTYDTAGYPTKITDPNDNTVERAFDKRGNVLATTTCRAAGDCQTSRLEYFINTGNVVDPRNDRVTKIHDARSAGTRDDTYATTLDYNEFGEQTKQTTPATSDFPNGRAEVIAYTDGSEPAVGGGATPAGLPETRTDPRGNSWHYAYVAAGDLAEQTSPTGLVTKLAYDTLGRLTRKKEVSAAHPNGVETTFVYDPAGRLVTQTDLAVKNEISGVIHTRQAAFTYDADGNQLTQSTADLTGGDPTRVTTQTYDSRGRLESVTGPEGGVVRQTWNTLGQLLTLTDARGTVVEYAYSKRGEQITKTLKGWTGSPVNPQPATDVVVESYAYDPAGRLAAQANAMGRKTSFTYFGDNLLKQKIADDVKLNGSTTAKDVVLEAHTYDLAGNRTRLVTGGGVTSTDYAYDAAGRLTSQTLDPAGLKRKTAFVYDASGNVIKTTLTGTGTTRTESKEYGYTPGNQISREVVDNGESDLVSTLTYDERGLVTAVTDPRGNIPGADAAAFTTTMRYDMVGRLVETIAPPVAVEKAGSATTARPSMLVGYNTAGERTHQRNAEGRITTSVFDRAGKVTSMIAPAYTPPGGQALIPKTTKVYDMAGQLVQSIDPSGAATTFTYDQLGRQVRKTDPATVASGPQPVAAYGMNEADGPAVSDVSGRNRHGEGRDIGRADGKYGKAVSFNGTSSWITVPDSASLRLSGAMTIEAWVNPATSEGNWRTVLMKEHASGLADGLYASTGTNTGPRAEAVTVTGSNAAATADSALPQGSWSHLAISYDGSSQRLYINGELVSQTPVEGDLRADDGAVRIGGNSPWGESFQGLIDEVRIYDQALTREQIKTDMTTPITTRATAQTGSWVTEYDLVGEPLASIDPLGARTEATYDDLGRRVTATQVERSPQAGAFTTRLEYNDAGQLTKLTDPKNKATTYTLNPAGQVTSVTSPLASKTTTAYDIAGRITKIVDPLGNATTAEYDLAGRKIATKDLDATAAVVRTFGSGYDPAGNNTSIVSPEGHATRQAYDALNRLTTLSEQTSATEEITTRFGYDATGARTRLTDGRGNSTWTAYNSLGLTETITEPATDAHPSAADRTWTTIYDASGNPVTTLQPGGVRIDRTFNALGRLTKESGGGGGAASAERTRAYDLAGRPTLLNDLQVTYNDRGHPLAVGKKPHLPEGSEGTPADDPLSTTFAYDEAGKVIKRTDPAGSAAFTWDAAGRLSTTTDPVTGRALTYEYDAADRLTSILGRSGSSSSDSQTFTYDSLDRLTSHTLKSKSDTQLAKITYGWDKDDNLTSKALDGLAGSGTHTYGYDYAQRLTSWKAADGTTTNYQWDAAGNRVRAGSKIFTYDERNRLTSGDGTTYTYTPRGTLASSVKAGATANLTFDAFDRLIADGESLYSYDALNRLAQRTRGTTIQQFAYAGLSNDIAAVHQAGGTVAKYGRGVAGELLGIQEGSASPSGAMTDLHNDLVATFSMTAVTGSTAYSPFGEPLARTGTQASVGYQSEYTDPDTGTVNMHARWYQPETGTFRSRDTATVPPVPSVQANRYTYGNASPLNGIDPTGHMTLYMPGPNGQYVPTSNPCWVSQTGNSYTEVCPPSIQDSDPAWFEKYVIKPSLPTFSEEEAKRVGVLSEGYGAGRNAPKHFWKEEKAARDLYMAAYRPGMSDADLNRLWKEIKAFHQAKGAGASKSRSGQPGTPPGTRPNDVCGGRHCTPAEAVAACQKMGYSQEQCAEKNWKQGKWENYLTYRGVKAVINKKDAPPLFLDDAMTLIYDFITKSLIPEYKWFLEVSSQSELRIWRKVDLLCLNPTCSGPNGYLYRTQWRWVLHTDYQAKIEVWGRLRFTQKWGLLDIWYYPDDKPYRVTESHEGTPPQEYLDLCKNPNNVFPYGQICDHAGT
ncbi:LamG-like jellyroll fold domain-containing protein [Nonomuraea typhae]|uniref:LamG-like jellyroll fold domain-containing protein n=1 Tax=Nonomuraea typhae TaxID=2603600 RepID=UPI0012FB4FC0|nr:LamG-like jellyroll fold domain-containing protein [Nonomuraea typhae]